jgi:hypothetical protein
LGQGDQPWRLSGRGEACGPGTIRLSATYLQLNLGVCEVGSHLSAHAGVAC